MKSPPPLLLHLFSIWNIHIAIHLFRLAGVFSIGNNLGRNSTKNAGNTRPPFPNTHILRSTIANIAVVGVVFGVEATTPALCFLFAIASFWQTLSIDFYTLVLLTLVLLIFVILMLVPLMLVHVLRMSEHRLMRQVLLNCVKPTHETLFADVQT